jgi:hypothetical protein
MQYTEHLVFERSAVLNHSPIVVYQSLKNINRMHKWHPFLYFDSPGPNILENTYHDYYNNSDNGLVTVTNHFNMLDGDIFLRTLIFLHRVFGLSPVYNVGMSDRLHIEFETVPDEDEKTSVTVKRRIMLVGTPTSSEENKQRTQLAYNKTDAIFNALVDLEPSESDGLLVLKDKPVR